MVYMVINVATFPSNLGLGSSSVKVNSLFLLCKSSYQPKDHLEHSAK